MRTEPAAQVEAAWPKQVRPAAMHIVQLWAMVLRISSLEGFQMHLHGKNAACVYTGPSGAHHPAAKHGGTRTLPARCSRCMACSLSR